MPYILRDDNGLVNCVMINAIDENTEYLNDDDKEVQYFNMRQSKIESLEKKVSENDGFIELNGKKYPLSGPLYSIGQMNMLRCLLAADLFVSIPDVNGDLVEIAKLAAIDLLKDLSNKALTDSKSYIDVAKKIAESEDFDSLNQVEI